jgi:alginate O-acetyltransferase complex protein AlgI
MLFNSIEFVFFFVIVLAIITIYKNKNFQHFFLLIASCFFLYFSNNYLIGLLIFSIILDFYVGKMIWQTSSKQKKKILLIISLVGNLGLLGFFKYADFAIMQFNIMGNYFDLTNDIPLLDLILPIGISFYTFQTITYTVDIYRGKLTPSKSLKEFALFVSFFPQLVAGPIVRASEFLPQLREKLEKIDGVSKLKQIRIHPNNLKLGITLMAFGFFKKMFFADNIAPLVNNVFADPIGLDSMSIMLGTLAFGIQIYGDFSGYTDIAIGAALILGFKLPINFNKPYFAISPSDFWRRWHISLSSWLRDYLYIPLGGNKKSKSRTYVNLAVVMILGGLWHGASWNFIIWGMLHGTYLAIHKLISDRFPSLKNNFFFKSKIGRLISILIMQYFVFLAWIPFRANNLEDAIYAIQKYVLFDFQANGVISLILQNKLSVVLIILFIILHIISYKKHNIVDQISKFQLRHWTIIIMIILGAVVFFYNGNPEDFIYFRF